MERILCAAIWYLELPLVKEYIPHDVMYPVNVDRGLVFCGYRHAHCMYSMVAITGLRSVEPVCGEFIEGFLTSKNRFVDREEGLQIALAANQIENLNDVRGNKFHSEDLYSYSR